MLERAPDWDGEAWRLACGMSAERQAAVLTLKVSPTSGHNEQSASAPNPSTPPSACRNEASRRPRIQKSFRLLSQIQLKWREAVGGAPQGMHTETGDGSLRTKSCEKELSLEPALQFCGGDKRALVPNSEWTPESGHLFNCGR